MLKPSRLNSSHTCTAVHHVLDRVMHCTFYCFLSLSLWYVCIYILAKLILWDRGVAFKGTVIRLHECS